MPLKRETLLAVAEEIAHVSSSKSDIDGHVSVLEALVAEIDQLRALPLKDCEPPLIFLPISDYV